ncbi:acetyltransferase [Labilibaculum manganireducens]|uniref:Acetyltransferase n=1 Tax=Labilibaculum manganireducens TaxID=1940525 RepID=A0A2N3IEM8_9BACT|nr:acetyltransferase [Labilibaculum manganireducens]PKQ68759.1 acetyltransferase [Labilibaculum manganireducens]
MKRNLVLVGGGGHCKSVIDVAESSGYNILGILDTPEQIGNKVLSYEVIGNDDDIVKYVDEAEFLVTVGQIKDVSLRIRLHDKILAAGGKLATIIASTAYVSKYSVIGQGTVIMHNAFVNADVKIGEACIINSFANVEHDSIIGDFCHISTGVMVNGSCVIGNKSFIGSQSVLANNITITSDCVVAVGTTVNKNLKEKGIYFGNPAVLK